MDNKEKKLIGRAEKIDLVELDISGVPARVDTGAKTSSIWVSSAMESGNGLQVVFFGSESQYYTGKAVSFPTFSTTVVSSSTGEIQERYVIYLLIKLEGRRVRARFTLADRSTQVYPVLIGRNVLRGKFIVDVKKGKVLTKQEKNRTRELNARIDKKEEEI